MTLFLCLLPLIVSLLTLPAGAAQEIMTIPTRPDVTVKVLIMASAGSPKGTLLMFPGGNGANHFSERGGRFV